MWLSPGECVRHFTEQEWGVWSHCDCSVHFSGAMRTSHNQNSCLSRSWLRDFCWNNPTLKQIWLPTVGMEMKDILCFPECESRFDGSWRPFLGARLCQPPSRWLSSFPHDLIWFSTDRHWVTGLSLCQSRSPSPPANSTDHQMEKPLMDSLRHSPFKIYLRGEVKVNLSEVIYSLNFQGR